MKTGNPGSRRTPAIRSFATLATLLAAGVCGSAQFALENPQPNGYESGVGIVSGWHCTATEITLRFDCAADHAVCRDTFTAGSGTYRGDTAGVCGDTDNGFAFLVNFNNMGTGQKTVHAFADGVEFAAANFIVNHLGNRFISGLSAWTEVTLPALGKGARLTWQQSKQSFVITEIETLDFTLDQLLALAAGTWSGSWESPVGTGQLTMSRAAATIECLSRRPSP